MLSILLCSLLPLLHGHLPVPAMILRSTLAYSQGGPDRQKKKSQRLLSTRREGANRVRDSVDRDIRHRCCAGSVAQWQPKKRVGRVRALSASPVPYTSCGGNSHLKTSANSMSWCNATQAVGFEDAVRLEMLAANLLQRLVRLSAHRCADATTECTVRRVQCPCGVHVSSQPARTCRAEAPLSLEACALYRVRHQRRPTQTDGTGQVQFRILGLCFISTIGSPG